MVKSLRNLEEIKDKNPLAKLTSMLNGNTPLGTSKFLDLSDVFVALFLQHHGVFYLCQALDVNTHDQFVEHSLT